MDYLTFLLAVLHVYKALCEEMVWDTTVKLAENMTLKCVYSSMGTVTQLEWFKLSTTEKVSIAIFSPTYGTVIRKPYADRVHFLNSSLSLSDATLSFHNASDADTGFYLCLFDIFPHGHWRKVVQVVPSDSFEINVSSNSHMVSSPGENTTLTCEFHMKWPVQEVTWEKLQSHQIDHLITCNLSQGRSHTSKHQRQILSNCSQGMNRTFITMPHVTASDSGLYRCRFRGGPGEKETFVTRLTVTDGETDNQYIYFIAGGTTLLLLFVILPAPVMVILYNRRRTRRKRVQFKGSWDTENKASNNYRSPISISQLSEGAREDIYVNYPAFSMRPNPRV
ncbi:CD226 antigen [Rhinolophus sinicus]|uniref:CD226 antigen n=1 Tax=Rhinolophus sinicus TaxID=89399 RepID=UPI003D794369